MEGLHRQRVAIWIARSRQKLAQRDNNRFIDQPASEVHCPITYRRTVRALRRIRRGLGRRRRPDIAGDLLRSMGGSCEPLATGGFSTLSASLLRSSVMCGSLPPVRLPSLPPPPPPPTPPAGLGSPADVCGRGTAGAFWLAGTNESRGLSVLAKDRLSRLTAAAKASFIETDARPTARTSSEDPAVGPVEEGATAASVSRSGPSDSANPASADAAPLPCRCRTSASAQAPSSPQGAPTRWN